MSAGSALDDPAFTAATHDQRSVATLVHLRWATNGLAVQPQNSHPFVADGLAMAHNGSIKPMGPLDELLEPDIAASLRGTTDSERYFGVIRQHRRTAPNLAEAVRRAVANCGGSIPTPASTRSLLGEDQLIVVHAHARSRCSTRTSRRSPPRSCPPSTSRTTSRCGWPGRIDDTW